MLRKEPPDGTQPTAGGLKTDPVPSGSIDRVGGKVSIRSNGS